MNASMSENYNHLHHRLWSLEPEPEKCVVTATGRDSTSDVENDHPYCLADDRQNLNLQKVHPGERLQVGQRFDIATMQNYFSDNQVDCGSIDPILQNQIQPLSEISQRQNFFELQVKVVADLVDFDADTDTDADMDGKVLYNKLKGSNKAETPPPLVQHQEGNNTELIEVENSTSFGMQSAAGVQCHQKPIEIASREEIDLKWHIRVMKQMQRAFVRVKLMLNNSNYSQSETSKMYHEFVEFCHVVERKLDELKKTLAEPLNGLTLAGRLMEFDLHWYQVFFESELPAVKKQLENHNVFPSTVNSGSGEITSIEAGTTIKTEVAAFCRADKFSNDNGPGDGSNGNGNYSKVVPYGNDDEMDQDQNCKPLLKPIHMEIREDTPLQKPHTITTLTSPGTRRSNRQRVEQTWMKVPVNDIVTRNRRKPKAKTAIVKTITGDGSGETRSNCKFCHRYLTVKYLRSGHKRWCKPVPAPVVDTDTSIESPRSPLSIVPALQPA